MATSPISIAAVTDPSAWPMTGIGTYGAVGTFVPGAPGDGAFTAPTGTSLVTRGFVLDGDVAASCPDPALVPLTSLAVQFTVTATANDVEDDYGIGVIDTIANAELPILTINYGALLFGGPSGHVFVGQQSTGDATPGLPSGSTPTPVTIDAVFDAAGYTLADLLAGTLAVGALLAPEGGAPSTGADPAVTVDFDDTACVTEPPAPDLAMVVPVNARLRQCDLDYLASQIGAPAPLPEVQGRLEVLLPGDPPLGFIGGTHAANPVRSITVTAVGGVAVITDAVSNVHTIPDGMSVTWSATGDSEPTNGLIESVAPSGTGEVIVNWTEVA